MGTSRNFRLCKCCEKIKLGKKVESDMGWWRARVARRGL